MKITAATFHACVTSLEALPPEKFPVIALVGRSNVGKSSLINTLVGRRELAKTSATPGKTLTINFYLINDRFYLVDLPGYGYAKASRITRQRIQKMMDEFFEGCPEIKGLVQVIDARHPPSPLDLQMQAWVRERGFPYLAVLTKVDKLTQQQVQRQRRELLKDLGVSHAVMFSAKTRQGREELLESFGTLLDSGAFSSRGGGQPRREAGGEARSRGQRQGGGGRERHPEQHPASGPGKPRKDHGGEPAGTTAASGGPAPDRGRPPSEPTQEETSGFGPERQPRRRQRPRSGGGSSGGGQPGPTGQPRQPGASGPAGQPGASGPAGQPGGRDRGNRSGHSRGPGDRNRPASPAQPRGTPTSPEPAQNPHRPMREPVAPISSDQNHPDKGENPS